jgi:hypothetical protein
MGDEGGCAIAASVVNSFDFYDHILKKTPDSRRVCRLLFSTRAPKLVVAASRSPYEK